MEEIKSLVYPRTYRGWKYYIVNRVCGGFVYYFCYIAIPKGDKFYKTEYLDMPSKEIKADENTDGWDKQGVRALLGVKETEKDIRIIALKERSYKKKQVQHDRCLTTACHICVSVINQLKGRETILERIQDRFAQLRNDIKINGGLRSIISEIADIASLSIFALIAMSAVLIGAMFVFATKNVAAIYLVTYFALWSTAMLTCIALSELREKYRKEIQKRTGERVRRREKGEREKELEERKKK